MNKKIKEKKFIDMWKLFTGRTLEESLNRQIKKNPKLLDTSRIRIKKIGQKGKDIKNLLNLL